MNPMPRILVIADDLTGAADSAVAFAGHGLHTVVALGPVIAEACAEVVSVDADTRRLSPRDAADETARLLRAHLSGCSAIVYKKIDSMMRGNIGEELAAVLETRRSLASTLAPVVAVLAPAFPAMGRTTVTGQQLLRGQPLASPASGRNNQIHGSSDIGGLLHSSHLQSTLLGLEQIRGDAGELQRIFKTLAQQADVIVCDAETEDDLSRVAEASMVLGRETIWAGSAGLARHLPHAASITSSLPTSHSNSLAGGPTLFVVGSNSIPSLEQVEVLASESDIRIIRVPPGVLLDNETSSHGRAFVLELENALNSGVDVAVVPDWSVQLTIAEQARISSGLSALVSPFAHIVGGLLATGGATARAVLEAWGVNSLRLIGEVEPGLPFSVTSGWKRELPVITKAGEFGNRDSLLRCRQFIHDLPRTTAITKNRVEESA